MIDFTTDCSRLGVYGAWHLVFYLSKYRNTPGTYSNYIIKFKEKEVDVIKAWTKWALIEIPKLNIHFDYIIRALGSAELRHQPDSKGLDIIGGWLAKKMSSVYCPEVLMKTRVTKPMHTLKTRPEREAEMHMAYVVADKKFDLNNKNILIIDDVTTAKITTAEMLRALRVEWPRARFYIFCLGKTEYEDYLNDVVPINIFNKLLNV
ncbi:hypothetical protein [Chitinophaga sancti]|uniref:Predicted amidophosphoribosyltransferases n=1 Tax=Chitinophaga sancti TaxID=1004 RepID=A0A1K1SIR7_9BACT|nr:hypothetical protein [Chitinophaga sancti]WQD61779.1 hypothetical protein U0033_28255 [Chitinophaga sancti]WQG92652.1 hypothetical protein SR876_14130 [Chitinophaga sancti]SFW84036.1 Predicted amidophosphoribosyltransferases [Chitinophaga sancti]